ncbi:Aste57867_11551 [Aphanomyces stellatus]|uniref:Aste57867_11551 protein n=1 Tax=Aphanomyces stellatus TaxID=120398 RepID=A0A485KTV4_9STRA|nr:hypothetical protein As57867_011508 [Aphanomyces stellatus]VFT88411.1 Aste57867_11551 [Aphanomyces stellatus]
MGRSQLQFRARGRGGGGGREGGRGRGGRGSTRQPVKPLESNAYRFAEEEEGDEEYSFEDDDAPATAKGDLRFNADIQHMPQAMSTGGAGHFQTKTMREWEDGGQKQSIMTLDLKAIGSQLKSIPPEKRFLIDPKYCIDLSYEQSVTVAPPQPPSQTPPLVYKSEPVQPPQVTPPTSVISVATPIESVAPLNPPALFAPVVVPPLAPVSVIPPVAAPACEYDDELDELLNM